MQNNANEMAVFNTAIYVRLSKEDIVAAQSGRESNSITNQKQLILDFLKDKPEFNIVSIRIDDGYTGTNFDRPAFQRMLNDIKAGRINCVVVKDLSRFGREYINSGKYIHRLFPVLGVRLIAINDNIDTITRDESSEFSITLKNLMNDNYSRDISVKVRSQLQVKRKHGDFICPFAPYGYQKCEGNHNRIEPDPYAATVVQDIFNWKIQGMTNNGIAIRLAESGILAPLEYKRHKGEPLFSGFKMKERCEWTAQAVARILTNPIYIGTLRQGLRRRPNYKIKKSIPTEENEWVVIHDAHEPVVTKRTFYLAQKALLIDTRAAPRATTVYPLSGLLECGECGNAVTRSTINNGYKLYSYFRCSVRTKEDRCELKQVPEAQVEAAVLQLLQEHISAVVELDRCLSEIQQVPYQKINVAKCEQRREKLSAEIARYRDLKASLYCDDDISGVSFVRPEFARMMNDIRAGKVTCVIVKDLSRLGRNMIENGEYIEQIFPRMGVRFISVTDRFDSLRDDADISIQLKNFANEAYARDISKKIRAVKRTQQLAGKWTTGTPPYGYMLDPDDKYHLFADPQTGPIVLAIFRMVAENHTLHFIAKTLNEQGVPSPGRYLYDIGLRKTEKFKNAIWYLQTIKKILVDPVYLGWIVSGKYRSQLCDRGTKTTVKTPEEEWIINKGMHEPIVSKELFDKVQDILSARQSEQGLATIYDSKSKRRSMFKGILRCGECGRSMYLRSKSNRGYYYYCTLHENYNATICPKKAVKQEDVESLALRLIQTQIRAFSDAQRLIANLNATPSSQTRYQIYETQIDDAKRNIEKFNQLKAALYGDFADGLLSHQDYTDLSEDYSRRADDLRIFIAELEKEKEKYSAGFGSKMQWALLVEKYKDQESLDAEMAAAFIETLTLFNDGHVEVAFRHRDEIEQVLYVAATRGKEAERYAG